MAQLERNLPRRSLRLPAALCLLGSLILSSAAAADAGEVVWFDLLTEDAERAVAFYEGLFDWVLTRSRSGNYVATAGSVPFAGISQIERTLPAVDESTWMVSVEVEDVPGAVARAKSLGAEILQDTVTDDELAVWAVIEDPQGAQLSLVDPKQRVGYVEGHGAPYWAELWTENLSESSGFYSDLLGWSRSAAQRSGKEYPIFGALDAPRAGLVEIDSGEMETGWAAYFEVADLGETVRKARELGGEILLEPSPEVDGGAVAAIRDPTGVAFVVIEMEAE